MSFDKPETDTKPYYNSLETDHDRETQKLLDEHFAHRIRLGGYITYAINGVQHIEDKNGVRPFPYGSKAPEWPDSAELQIRELAWMNRIRPTTNGVDVWAKSVSALADDEIEVDEVEQLIANLGRANLVDGIELTKLHARYLNERDNKDK